MKVIVLTALGFMLTSGMHVQGANETVGSSPWGPNDEIGRPNLMTNETQLNVLSRMKSGKIK